MSAGTTAVTAAYKANRTVFGESITYTRGAQSVSLTVLPARSVVEIDRGGDVYEHIQSRDFLILASELLIAGSAVLPQRYDTITHGAKVYNVLDNGSEAMYTWNDPTQVVLRVHTKQD